MKYTEERIVHGYKLFVRPLLEYDCSVWDPHNIELTKNLEVERSLCRLYFLHCLPTCLPNK